MTARETIWKLVDSLAPPERKPCFHCDGEGGTVYTTWTTIKGVLVPDDEIFEKCYACGGTGLAPEDD